MKKNLLLFTAFLLTMMLQSCCVYHNSKLASNNQKIAEWGIAPYCSSPIRLSEVKDERH